MRRVTIKCGSRLWAALTSVLLVTLATPLIVPACAEDPIRDIEIKGNQRIEAATIRSHMSLSAGDRADPEKINAALKALYATGQFADVRVDRAGPALTVTVVENPTVNSFAFEGNRELEKSALELEVQLKPRAVYTRAKAEADARRIVEAYRRQGRNATTVEPRIAELPGNRVDLVFTIRESEVTKIKHVVFVGNRAFTDKQLRDTISTAESGWLDYFKTSVFHDQRRLELDRDLLLQRYLKNGYADARVRPATVDHDPEGNGFYVTFSIEEGERYTFGAVGVDSGMAGISPGPLQSEVETRSGEVYNGALIEKSVEKIGVALAEQGHNFARVRLKTDRNSAARTIGLTYLIEEGPRVYIDRITILGNQRTKDHVIRHELRLAEGDAFNPLMVARARKRLQALGFFKSVEIKPAPTPAPDRVALTVEVVEQDTGELGFGIGYSSTEGVIGDISYTERNLLGNGQYLRLKLAGSLSRLHADISFTEPRFLGTNLAAGFDLFYKDTDLSAQSSYKSQKVGGALRLGAPLSEHLSGSVNYTLSRNQLYDVGPLASAAIKDAVPNSQSATYYTSSIGYSLSYDRRDRPRNPTSGIYLTTSQDLAGIGGDVRYLRTTAEARGYYPIADGVTLAGRMTGGTIFGWGGQDVRLLDLFYRGGETVRGFAPSGIGPRDLLSANRDALGGAKYFATTAELRFPVPLVPEEVGVRGAVFADAGSLWSATSSAKGLPGLAGNAPALRVSVGTGVIWDSPIGPLRFDYAVPVVKQPYDKTESFRFGLAPPF